MVEPCARNRKISYATDTSNSPDTCRPRPPTRGCGGALPNIPPPPPRPATCPTRTRPEPAPGQVAPIRRAPRIGQTTATGCHPFHEHEMRGRTRAPPRRRCIQRREVRLLPPPRFRPARGESERCASPILWPKDPCNLLLKFDLQIRYGQRGSQASSLNREGNFRLRCRWNSPCPHCMQLGIVRPYSAETGEAI